ncbi:MAG: hypothetical protein HC896_07580 [Bacteroidales bacterium]|nr:hypothetical protein [Bacteroidales bacterium]
MLALVLAGSLKIFASANDDNDQYIEFSLEAHTNGVNSLAIGWADTVLITGGEDNLAKIWNLNTLELVKALEGHYKPVQCVKYAPKKQYIATAGDKA